ncbi:MAG: SAM-dependent methyltransferase [Saprospiraceae bacterium]|nr:SAM-dependent methyltransferase [Saprospiraceae bacterium]MBK7789319.1 SAM-dependent methyltransferase [Saprospiraceae bacterium]MBK8852274.1 SAM-dependent methyltransferase [Saprospiraceae bacterium]
MATGNLYLIPVPIHDDGQDTIPAGTLGVIQQLDFYLAERAKTARKFIKILCPDLVQANLTVEEMTDNMDVSPFIAMLKRGKNVGLMSEAGNPCIADPGHQLVSAAHKEDIPVIALTGPSSILLALIASGFNGQQFTFHGYLPNKKDALITKLKSLEQVLLKTRYTQIFMETPYRNHFIWDGMMSSLSDKTMVCVACDLGSELAFIKTLSVQAWKKKGMPDIQKKPAIFLIG